MQAPQWVFLDLDNTLWDFDGNAEAALAELFHRHHLHLRSTHSVHEFVEIYKTVNAAYWRRYEKGEIEKNFLRTARFTDTFIEMGIPASEHPENIWQEYLEICPQMTRMIPDAEKLLATLSKHSKIALITNGFAQTQSVKIAKSGIEAYIEFMITSEDAGYAKPDKRIFELALKKAQTQAHSAIYIGDTWHTDMEGGIQTGLPVLWYNPLEMKVGNTQNPSPLLLGEFQTLAEILRFFVVKWNWV